MDEKTQTKIFEFLDRALTLLDKLIERKYPEQKVQNGEVWKKGEPLPEPTTIAEYRDFPRDQPGRFQQAITAANRGRGG